VCSPSGFGRLEPVESVATPNAYSRPLTELRDRLLLGTPFIHCALTLTDGMLPVCSHDTGGVKLRSMRRQIIVLVLMLAVCLQTAPVLLAASPQMPSECQTTSAAHSDKSCCPSGVHTASCCLDACLMAASIAFGALPLVWHGHSALGPRFQGSTFSSRGDAPLIRPPIL
jgi:hypothetical protein